MLVTILIELPLFKSENDFKTRFSKKRYEAFYASAVKSRWYNNLCFLPFDSKQASTLATFQGHASFTF